MTQTEYDQKKRECWEEFCESDKPYDVEPAFDFAFDRAYALGKQEKDGIDLKKLDKMLDDALEKETKESLNQWLSEKDADTVIQGWVARDKGGALFIYAHKPSRIPPQTIWYGELAIEAELNTELFPDLTWESEPLEVELTIRRKKK